MPRPSRSPFFFFAREFQHRCERDRGQRISINEAIAACYDDWKALPVEAKQPYKTQYDEWRMQYRVNPAQACPPNQRGHENKQVKNDRILRQRDIPSADLKLHYDRFSLERIFLTNEYLPLDKSELLSMPIYIINFQIFCEIDVEDGGQFVPAEICILCYTLNEGVTMYEQRFIKPDKIPSGYMSSCLEHTNETHQIPLKDFCEATDNYKQIYHELKSFVQTTINDASNHSDDRSRRRYLRSSQPCVFFPSLEYEQTSKLLDWLQEKAEGKAPTKDTRLVNLSSIESLIMVLAELKKHHVSHDDIEKTFANAAYSFMIEERCPYHAQLGVNHCSVARCHAGAKLISAYLNQLFAPERPVSAKITTEDRSQNSFMSKRTQSNRTPTATHNEPVAKVDSSKDTNDSMASSYRPFDQRKQNDEITKLQQQNFHRLLSNAQSTDSSHNDHLSDYAIDSHSQISDNSNTERTRLNQRKLVLLKAIQSIDEQIEELNLNSDT
ncbi:unnamed protein product [Rotaria magnacalcarata]|uniref:HMG box domain-containing protein n=1 Tax=Rotaria magnacalcarata TaxID=392030 RepID=A0A816DLY6_9BILA|nr:unnamed protein product [Rotaria magnacalcarata]CAF1640393.1 unnamed protein product [Rotaria magnacalcarata]CAF2011755.1 unnamed protein product [Rotaria magnacalcarata]CAF2118952.1 unnamed protein product [Rotaria magnacalcarata]CAF3779463.1 unnamed protein product [Rotaria magnacalcarata]